MSSRRVGRELGQHFLTDRRVAARIAAAADLSRDDLVLEVGAGRGALTVQLARKAGEVVAVEVDARLLGSLREALREFDNVRVVHGDILKQDVGALVGYRPYKVVANLPYYITSAVLRHLLEADLRPRLLVVTVQREVAERIVARPGQQGRRAERMSLLSLSVQFYGQPRIVARLPAGAFYPPPKVESAVVRVDTFDPLPWGEVDEDNLFRVARAGFAQSRKQLRNALAAGLSLPVREVVAALETAGINPSRRAETLSVAEWVALSRALAACLARPHPGK